MSTRSNVLTYLLVLLISLTITPNVQAQLGITSIDNLQYPSQAVLQNGVAQVTVTFTMYYNYFMGARLVFGIYDASTSNALQGSATATPVPCQPQVGTQNVARCDIIPPSRSGVEYAMITLTFNSPRQYALRAVTGVVDDSGVVSGGSSSSSDFTISVTGAAQAPPTTTITSLQYPKQAVLQNGLAQATVTLTAGFSGLPSGDYLTFAIAYVGASNMVTGSVTSTPDACQSSIYSGTVYANSAICTTTPASSSGTEYVSFVLTFNSTREYTLAAVSLMSDRSGNTISGGETRQTFTISVTGAAQASTTQRSTSTSTTTTASTFASSDAFLYVIALIVIIGLIVFVDRRKKKRGPSVMPPTQPYPSAPQTEGTAFCIQCGARIPVTARFCERCGSKQN